MLFAITAFTWSCNEQSKKIEDAVEKVAKIENVQYKQAEQQVLKNLRKTNPVNVEDIEGWFPQTLGGLSLERIKSASIFGEVSMMGWYKRER